MRSFINKFEHRAIKRSILIVAPSISSKCLISIPTDARTQKFHINTYPANVENMVSS